MKALVTGGSGFLGRYIVERLLDAGARVRVLSRRPLPELEKQGAEIVISDIRDPVRLQHACVDRDTIFHTAAIPGIWGKWKDHFEINTRGTQNLIAAAQGAGVVRFVHTSTPSVVYDGKSHHLANEDLPYAKSFLCHYPHTKKLAEELVLNANGPRMSTVALRPHLIWGPRDPHLIPRLIERARTGKLRRVGDGKNLVSLAYVENVAEAHIQAARVLAPDSVCAGNAYFINDPEPVNLWDWIDQVLEAASLPRVDKSISASSAMVAGSILEFVYKILPLKGEPRMTRFLASQLSNTHCYDPSRATRDFGYRPIVPPAQAFNKLIDSLRRE